MIEPLEKVMESNDSIISTLHDVPVSPGTHCLQSGPVKFSAQTALIVRSIVRKLWMPV